MICRFSKSLILWCWLFANTAVQAQNRLAVEAIPPPEDSLKHYPQAEVSVIEHTVKGNNTATEINFSQKQLQELQVRNLGEAGGKIQGFNLKDYGGLGGLKTLSYRGMGSGFTGISYNNQAIPDAAMGMFDLGTLSTENIQQLQFGNFAPVGRITSARLFGYGNYLIAKPETPQEDKLSLGTEWGSFAERRYRFNASLGKKRLKASVAITNETYEGNYTFQLKNGQHTSEHNRINNQMWRQAANAQLAYYGNNWSVGSNFRGQQANRNLPGAIILYAANNSQNLAETDLQGNVFFNIQPIDGVEINTSVGQYRRNTNYTDPLFLNGFGGLTVENSENERNIQLGIAYSNPNWKVAYNAEGYHTGFFSSHQVSLIERTVLAHNLSFELKPFNKLPLKAEEKSIKLFNIRNLLVSSFAHQLQGEQRNLNISNRVNSGLLLNLPLVESRSTQLNIYTHWRDQIRLPSFTEQFANPYQFAKLRPETSQQLTVGLSFNSQVSPLVNLSGKTELYRQTLQDKILAIPGRDIYLWSIRNIAHVEAQGWESHLSTTLLFPNQHKLNISGHYTLQYIQQVFNNTNSRPQQLAYTPFEVAQYQIVYTPKAFSIGLNGNYNGLRYKETINTAQYLMPAFYTQDVFVATTLPFFKGNKTCFRAEVMNLFNTQYQIIDYFPMPGRWFRFSLNFSIQ